MSPEWKKLKHKKNGCKTLILFRVEHFLHLQSNWFTCLRFLSGNISHFTHLKPRHTVASESLIGQLVWVSVPADEAVMCFGKNNFYLLPLKEVSFLYYRQANDPFVLVCAVIRSESLCKCVWVIKAAFSRGAKTCVHPLQPVRRISSPLEKHGRDFTGPAGCR